MTAIRANATRPYATLGNLDFWLGMPGSLALLPSPNDAVSRPRLRGRAEVKLYNGGSTVLMNQYAKGQWALSWDHLYDADADLLHSFTEGGRGRGPFGLVDPTVRNVLSFDAACCGVRTSAGLEWAANGGTLAPASVVSPVPGSGVLTWSGMDVGDQLTVSAAYQDVGLRWIDLDSHAWADDPYTWAGYGTVQHWVADLGAVPLWVDGQTPVTLSVYLASAAGASVSLSALCLDMSGATLALVNLAGATLRSGVTRLVGTLTGAPAGTAYVVPVLTLTAAPAPVQLCAAQVEYAPAASPWQPGYGSPRVIITVDPDVSVPQLDYTTTVLALAQV